VKLSAKVGWMRENFAKSFLEIKVLISSNELLEILLIYQNNHEENILLIYIFKTRLYTMKNRIKVERDDNQIIQCHV
jgi:hypothetical protein